MAKVGRTDSEERVSIRSTNEVVRPAAGSILFKGPRIIIIDDESKPRHRAAREQIRRDGGKQKKKKWPRDRRRHSRYE